MDSTVDAALAAKLSLLFPPNEGVFLAFPRSGAAFTLAELDLFDTGEGTAQDVRIRGHHKAQFARIVNQVPHDSPIYHSTDRLLWQEYSRILERAQVAKSVLTASEARQLGQARDLLEAEVEVDGLGTTTVYSPKLTAYYQYKEAWEDAERVYLDEKITAEASADRQVKADWDDRREAELDDIRTRAVRDWELLGFKDAVIEAQATIASLGGRSPEVLRQELLSNYEACVEPDLVANDPNGVLSTFFSPSDIFDPEVPWEKLHLSADEVRSLHAQAPPELRSSSEHELADIESVTIEYADVTLVRPWLNHPWFAMTSWRLPRDDDATVSDGKVPRSGTIPAHIASMIVARRVVVKRREARSEESTKGTSAQKALSMSMISRAVLVAPTAARFVPMGSAKRAADHATYDAIPMRPRALTVLKYEPMVQAKASGMTITRANSTPTVRADLRAALAPSEIAGARRGKSSAPAPSAPAETDNTTDVDLESVVVLAYRCRRTPQSPHPDISLDWGDGRAEPKGTGAPAASAVDSAQAAPPFPLLDRHSFAATKGERRHTGHASAEDRSNIRTIQTRLVGLGHNVAVDGYLGPHSEAALRAFQEAVALDIDGLVGPQTWAALWR